MNTATYHIYALINPLDNSIFYIGRTEKDLHDRLKGHLWSLKSGRNIRLIEIIKSILAKEKKPEIRLIETVPCWQQLREAELIEEYSKMHPLVNILKKGYSARFGEKGDNEGVRPNV